MPLKARLCLGITGHRQDDPLFVERQQQIAAALTHVFDLIDQVVAEEAGRPGIELAATRLHGLLADGTDQLAAQAALERGWELVAPLPFGLALAATISAQPRHAEEAQALLAGWEAPAPALRAEARERAGRLYGLAARARLFELADSDPKIIALLRARLAAPQDLRKAATFEAEISLRAAMASRVVVEQSDFLVAVWDGVTRAAVGGTGHTIQMALEAGAAVVWIDANQPAQWRLLSGAEALADVGTRTFAGDDAELLARLRTLVRMALRPAAPRGHGVLDSRATAFDEAAPAAAPRPGSPEAAALRGANALLSTARTLEGTDLGHLAVVETEILQRFARTDRHSAQLSNRYRGVLMAGFLLAAMTITGGAAGLLSWPGMGPAWWPGLLQLAALGIVLAWLACAHRGRWYSRWRESRRVAEYLRHASVLLLLGVARAPGRWPVGMQSSWPEWYARHVLRAPGLPHITLTPGYLKAAVRQLLQPHLAIQLDYYRAKARRMQRLQRNLDRLAIALLLLAMPCIAGYLLATAGVTATGMSGLPQLLGAAAVVLPAFAVAVAGIRYFGDFERLAEISSVTAEKLHAIAARAERLLAAQDGDLDYGRVAHLAHALEEVVVGDIESWQPVFGGNDVTLPL